MKVEVIKRVRLTEIIPSQYITGVIEFESNCFRKRYLSIFIRKNAPLFNFYRNQIDVREYGDQGEGRIYFSLDKYTYHVPLNCCMPLELCDNIELVVNKVVEPISANDFIYVRARILKPVKW